MVHGSITDCRLTVHPLAAAGKRLAFLTAYLFIFVADAFALVWLRLAHPADLGGILTDFLLVGPLDDNGRRVGKLDRHSFRRRHIHGMRITDGQQQAFLVQARLIADTLDLEPLLES